MANLGGARPGAGRKPGGMNQKTKDRMRILKAYQDRIAHHADTLFNAQFGLAKGQMYLYRIEETGSGKDKKREHVLVTSPEEIKQVLDETDGAGGAVDGNYYYITTKEPDPRAIDSMLDRAFGKPIQVLAGDSEGGPVQLEISEKQYERIIRREASRYKKGSKG